MSELREWLEPLLETLELSEESRGYLLARGATSSQILSWGCFTWECPSDPCPDEGFRKSYGSHGEKIEDRLIIPLFTPRGQFVGWDSRATGLEKRTGRYRIGDCPWEPVFLGIQDALPKLWEGSDVYIVEGAFDVFALQRARPEAAVLGSGPAALNYLQLAFLRRFSRGRIWMAYDNDSAGKKGAEKAMKDLKYRRKDVQVLRYGEAGDDPGKIWSDGGEQKLLRVFARDEDGYVESQI